VLSGAVVDQGVMAERVSFGGVGVEEVGGHKRLLREAVEEQRTLEEGVQEVSEAEEKILPAEAREKLELVNEMGEMKSLLKNSPHVPAGVVVEAALSLTWWSCL
jgi:hypothetical protein